MIHEIINVWKENKSNIRSYVSRNVYTNQNKEVNTD
jgi:hypothetical protein